MENIVIIVVIAIMLLFGLNATRKHFKGQGGCCGGGNTYISRKKLKTIVMKKTIVIDGMMCENCKTRVERVLNDMEHIVANVNLKKGEAYVQAEMEISDEKLKEVIEKAGYSVIKIV